MQFSELTAAANLSVLQLRAAFRELGFPDGLPAATVELGPEACLGFRIYQLLQRLPELAVEQKMLLFGEVAKDLPVVANCLQQGKPALLVIADGRWALWTTRRGWLELDTGNTCTDNVSAFVTVAYNLQRLYEESPDAEIPRANRSIPDGL